MTARPARRHGAALVALALALAALLTSCTTTAPTPTTASADPRPSSSDSTTGPSPTPTPTPDGPTATATATTLFDTQRTFRLELTAAPDRGLAVTGIALDSPWYEPLPVAPRTTTLSAGGTLLVPLAYGPADCTAGSPAPGDPVGDVVLATAEGEQRIPLGQRPDTLVGTRHARECALEAVRAAFDLSFGDDWAVVGERAVIGDLVVAPRGDAAGTVVAVEGNVVFTTTSDALPVPVADDVVAVPVRVAATRCDTHALIEAKRKLVMPVEVALADVPPVPVDVEATGAAARVFQGLLEACLDDPPTGS